MFSLFGRDFFGELMRKGGRKILNSCFGAAFRRPALALCVLGAVLAAAAVPLFAVGRDKALSVDFLSLLNSRSKDGGAALAAVRYQQVWGRLNNYLSMVVTPKLASVNSTNVLLKELLLELLDFELRLRGLLVQDGVATFSFGDVCLQPYSDGRCLANTVLDYWKLDRSALANDGDILRSVSRPGAKSNIGVVIDPSSVMGGIVRQEDLPTRIASARWLSISYAFDASDEAARRFGLWRVAAADLIATTEFKFFDVETFGLEDVVSAFLSPVVARIYAPAIGVVAFLLLCCVSLSVERGFSLPLNIAKTCLKALLPLCFLLLSVTSVVAALGILCLCGVPISPFALVVLVLPLLLVIGFCTIALFSSFREYSCALQGFQSLERSMADFGSTGLALIFSTIFVALLCMVSPLPGIRQAAAQLAVSALFFAFVTVFGFPALVSFDSKASGFGRLCIGDEKIDRGQQITKTPTALAWSICCVGAALLILSLVGAVLVKPSVNLQSAFPPDSASAAFLSKNAELSPSFSLPFLLFFGNSVQYGNRSVQDGMPQFNTALQELPCVSGSTVFWLNDFKSWIHFLSNHSDEYAANGNYIPSAKLVPWLREFVDGIGKPHGLNLVWSQNGSELASTRIMGVVNFNIASFHTLAQAEAELESFCKTFGGFVNDSTLAKDSALAYSPAFGFATLVQNVQRDTLVVAFVGTALCVTVLVLLLDWTVAEFAAAFCCALSAALELAVLQGLVFAANSITVPAVGIAVALTLGLSGTVKVGGVFNSLRPLLLFAVASALLLAPLALINLPLLRHYIVFPLVLAVVLALANSLFLFPALRALQIKKCF